MSEIKDEKMRATVSDICDRLLISKYLCQQTDGRVVYENLKAIWIRISPVTAVLNRRSSVCHRVPQR